MSVLPIAAYNCCTAKYDCRACLRLRGRKRPRPYDALDGHDSDGDLNLPFVAPLAIVALGMIPVTHSMIG